MVRQVMTRRAQVGEADPGNGQGDGSDGFVAVAAADDLADGQMIGVEIDGERVLVAKVDGAFYAIGGICTHERANLDDGALYDDVVYCPLHYSAFDIRSGAVLGPPADRPTPTYAVRIEDGKVLVSTRSEGGGAPVETSDEVRHESLERARPWHGRVEDRIDAMRWLQRLSDWMTLLITPVRSRLARIGVLDFLHGRWFGHSLHPVLSDLPIGLWASSLLLYFIGDAQPAAILGIVGTGSALATAATGIVDLSVADGHERRAGLLHGLLMTGAILVQVGSSVAYYAAGAERTAIGFSVAGLGITVAAAYLGGHLVFGRATMVNHTAWPPGPVQWVRTVPEAELDAAPGRFLVVDADDKKVLLHRNQDQRISAVHNACSHAGAPLSLGRICDDVVTCPWHESEFRLRDGAVVRGPAIYPQPVFEVRVRDGCIEVRSPA